MNRVGMGGVALGKLDGPWQAAKFSITTSGHQAADPTNGMTEGETGRESVEGGPKGHLVFASENPDGNGGANERAVEHYAGAIQDQVCQGCFAIPMVDDVQQFCTDEPADYDPEKQVGDIVCLKSDAGATQRSRPHAKPQARSHKNAIPMNGEVANFKCDWVH